jgi:hypothetical protein
MSYEDLSHDSDGDPDRIKNLPFGIEEEDLQDDSEANSSDDSDAIENKRLDKMERGINTQLKMKAAYDHSKDKNKLAKDQRRKALVDL